MNEEVLKVLVDKTVDNGKAIRDMKEQIAEINPAAVVAVLEQRMGALEEKVSAAAMATGERIGELATKVNYVGGEVAGMVHEVVSPGSRLMTQMKATESGVQECMQFFKNPMVKEVHHRHFVGRAIYILAGMCVVIVLSWCEVMRLSNRAAQYERNDILWRGAVEVEDSVVMGALNKVQHAYDSGPEEFRKGVIDEEERLEELGRRLIEKHEQQERIDELENKKKKK